MHDLLLLIKTTLTTQQDNEVGPAVFEHYLPKALERGKFVPAPEAEVVGKGLEFAQVALDKWAAGVSAKKIVFSV